MSAFVHEINSASLCTSESQIAVNSKEHVRLFDNFPVMKNVTYLSFSVAFTPSIQYFFTHTWDVISPA